MRLASINSLQIRTEKEPHGDFTTVRGRDIGGGGNVTGVGIFDRYSASSRAGSRFVHGHVATDEKGPGKTAKT